MPNSDPRDGFFYPTLTLVIDSYSIVRRTAKTSDQPGHLHRLLVVHAFLMVLSKGDSVLENELVATFKGMTLHICEKYYSKS